MTTALAAPGGEGWPACDHHPGVIGHIDETPRRLSHEEYAVAALLAGEGHDVRSLASRRGGPRTPDLEVCGRGVEVKSWLPVADRGGRPATSRSVLNKLLDASDQASACVLYGRGSGLSASTARAGVSLFATRSGRDRPTDVRVIGDGFDLSWNVSAGRALAQRVAPAGLGVV
jgi:hypothetical protein